MDGARPPELAWRRWAAAWSPVVVVGAAWTSLALPPSGVVAALLLFGMCSALVVGVVRDGRPDVPWVVAPVSTAWLTALLGPWVDLGLMVLPLVAAMVATSPWMQARRYLRRAALPPARLSDWDLEALWSDTESQLRRASAPPDQLLGLVLRRAELLDELVRRRGTRTL